MIKEFNIQEIKDMIGKVWVEQSHLQCILTELLDLNSTNTSLQTETNNFTSYEIRRNTNKIQNLLDVALFFINESTDKLDQLADFALMEN